jgi:glutamate N-acetyltransferase / amino-acid N-acetyltransferase
MVRKKSFKKIPGSICAPLGFNAAAVFCGIKTLETGKGSEKGQKPDLALIISDISAVVAGMFTTNQISAAPVKISARRARRKFARGIVVNSGNANACTGRQGMKDAREMACLSAQVIAEQYACSKRQTSPVIDRHYKIKAEDILVCSTGRIGVRMPMKNIQQGIHDCAARLARSPNHGREVAEAIMTTDTRRKEIAVEFKSDGATVRMGGICKGAGMIQPGMATMLAFITTDAAIESGSLKRALKVAVEQSFNRITIDGDMSTNDCVIMLANGLAGNPVFAIRDSKFELFQSALNFVTLELAKMIVRDGEGVSRFVTIRVRGARLSQDAENAARSIANSSLVRTSWCGGDPNWGRILCALGYSAAKVDESMVDVGYSRPGGRTIALAFRRGQPTNISFRRLARITARPEFEVHVDLHSGPGEFVLYASDLTENYVALNKGDVNDPGTLGG